MKKSKILPYILLIAVLVSVILPVSAYALTEPEVSSAAIVLVDTKTGDILYSKNEDEMRYPASTTKIMTALLAVEAIEDGKVTLSDSVTASGNIMSDLAEDGSTAGIVPGETMTLEDLLYCMMISSANEACNIVAEYIGGDIATFVGMMNARATELGCTGTNFTNTHGLPDYNHFTTAKDMVKIALEAYSHPLFAEICGTSTKTIPATNESQERHLSNTNGLINEQSDLYPGYYYEYAKGIKTGHTNDAGYCLVSAAEKDGVSLLCVLLGGMAINKVEKTEYTNFSDSITIYNWAFENFSYRDILETTDMVRDIPVEYGKDTDFVTVHPDKPIQALMASDEDNSSFEQHVTIYSEENGTELVAPIESDTVLGEVTVSRNGIIYGTSKLIACSSVEVSYSQMLKQKLLNTLKNPIAIVLLVVVFGMLFAYIFLVIRYRRAKREHMRKIAMRRRVHEQMLEERQTATASSRKGKATAGDVSYSHESDDLNTNNRDSAYETKAEQDYFDEFFGRNKK